MSFRFGFPPLPAGDLRTRLEAEESAAKQPSRKRPAWPSPLETFSPAPVTASPGPTTAGPDRIEKPDVALAQTPSPGGTSASQSRQVVFADPVAFRYLEEDPSVTVVKRRDLLHGYELYLVEQWACSRQSPTLVIATYTGDLDHSIIVGVLSIPTEEKDWSPRLRVYFKAIQQYHARPKETPLGELMVTNLSSFPSALTVIPVPDGDIRKHRATFIVNENLKRLGCSGRSGMTLAEPNKATQDKFISLYKTSDRISFNESVLELVKLCQVALFLFGNLEQEYIDGLLCDVTEKAINDWWIKIGSEYYNLEPTDGILGPTTVAALLGMLMGARNRLSWYGAQISKDVFDVDSTKRAIASFQKSYKLERTRRLDHHTLRRLHIASAKAASGDGGWGVQKAVKNTVEGFGGKRGELVIGMVSGKDKANIADVETLDLDRFIGLAQGERAKWLWHGKPRSRTHTDSLDKSVPDMSNILGREESAAPPSRRTHSLPLDEELHAQVQSRKEEPQSAILVPSPGPGALVSAATVPESAKDKETLQKAVFNRVAGKVSDARSGLGRIKDAVGGSRRGHGSRPSRDEGGFYGSSPGISSLAQASAATLSSPVMVGRAFTWKNKPEEYLNAMKKEKSGEFPFIGEQVQADVTDKDTPERTLASTQELAEDVPDATAVPSDTIISDIRKDLITTDASVTGSVFDETDLQGPILAAERATTTALSTLQRRHSIELSRLSLQPTQHDARWPRRMSFSLAEEAVLSWPDVISRPDSPTDADSDSANKLQKHLAEAELSRDLYSQLQDIQTHTIPYLDTNISALATLDSLFEAQQQDLQTLYYELSEGVERLRHASTELVAEERAHATEAGRDLEVLVAKLEYEIGALASRVGDVEDGVGQFESLVEGVESRAEELRVTLQTESWAHWAVRTVTGIGTGPNIVGDGR